MPSSAPQNLTITATVPNELTVTWDRPPEIDINGVLTFYSLRYHIVGSEDYEFYTVNGNLESIALTGLDNYTSYEVFIAALSINGTGPPTHQTATTSENGIYIYIYYIVSLLQFDVLFAYSHSSRGSSTEYYCK